VYVVIVVVVVVVVMHGDRRAFPPNE
jgi:hypothetical protein